MNWQRRTMRVVGEMEIEGQIETYRAGATQDETGALTERVMFRLRGGDAAHEPAFVMRTVDVQTRSGAGAGSAMEETSARRAGLVLRVETERSKQQMAAPLDSAVSAAAAWVAAAMPHERGRVLPVHLVSVRDFVARPGYVLITRGKEALPADTQPAATTPAVSATPPPGEKARAGGGELWRVDLQHCGVVVESYWFTEGRDLVREDMAAGTVVSTRRVADVDTARAELSPAPARGR
jgi:hypothetical protein